MYICMYACMYVCMYVCAHHLLLLANAVNRFPIGVINFGQQSELRSVSNERADEAHHTLKFVK